MPIPTRATSTAPSPTTTAPSQIDGKDPFRWNNRGLAMETQGRIRPRHRRLRSGDQIDPGYTAAYTNRGQTYEDKGDIERAKVDYLAALAVPQKYSNGKYAHDKARERLVALGVPSESLPRSAPRVVPRHSSRTRGSATAARRKLDEGIAACTRQIASGRWQGPQSCDLLLQSRDLLLRQGRNDKAIADYSKALELSPDYASAFNNRGNAHSAKGDLDRALADYDRAIEIDGKDPFRWNNRGLIWKRKADFDRAIADFDQAIKIDPGYTAAYTNRGETYEAKGDRERAIADYNAALGVPAEVQQRRYAHNKARERLAALGVPPSPRGRPR